jgi:uncharacterized membrane protein (UPF0127 family)
MRVARGRGVLLALAVVAAAACGGGLERATAVIETGNGPPVSVEVELAESVKERERGLMEREALPERSGMLFLFPEDHRGGFWMKNTLIPLSIAFLDADGQVLAVLDMEPCRADPCPIYDPGVSYRSALEVNQGALARWGVGAGDVVTVER